MQLSKLTTYLTQLLQSEKISDYCPNGLQVQGRSEVSKLITGVSVNQELLNAAIIANADAILVHHGFFWKGEDPCIIDIKHRRISLLIKADISLLAYHLPLDLHADYGNNVQLARQLDLIITDQFDIGNGLKLGFVGKLMQPMQAQEFAKLIANKLNREPLHVIGSEREIKTIAWCTGAAQDLITQALAYNVDAFLTGEVSERTVHLAKEANIHFFAAGHHATERYGVRAVGEHIAKQFGIEHEFIDIDNPV